MRIFVLLLALTSLPVPPEHKPPKIDPDKVIPHYLHECRVGDYDDNWQCAKRLNLAI